MFDEMFIMFDLIKTSMFERSQEKKEIEKGFQNNVLSNQCKMSIKQTLRKSKSKTIDEIDLCISSSKVVSATIPVISK